LTSLSEGENRPAWVKLSLLKAETIVKQDARALIQRRECKTSTRLAPPVSITLST